MFVIHTQSIGIITMLDRIKVNNFSISCSLPIWYANIQIYNKNNGKVNHFSLALSLLLWEIVNFKRLYLLLGVIYVGIFLMLKKISVYFWLLYKEMVWNLVKFCSEGYI